MEDIIRVFSSFDEADAANRKELAQTTPEERAEIFFQIRERSHPMPLHKDLREFVECLNSSMLRSYAA